MRAAHLCEFRENFGGGATIVRGKVTCPQLTQVFSLLAGYFDRFFLRVLQFIPSPQKPTFKLSLRSEKAYKAKSLSDPGTVKCHPLRNNVSLIVRNTK